VGEEYGTLLGPHAVLNQEEDEQQDYESGYMHRLRIHNSGYLSLEEVERSDDEEEQERTDERVRQEEKSLHLHTNGGKACEPMSVS
jgi:hypothetical protein